jgi:hypothetical protein
MAGRQSVRAPVLGWDGGGWDARGLRRCKCRRSACTCPGESQGMGSGIRVVGHSSTVEETSLSEAERSDPVAATKRGRRERQGTATERLSLLNLTSLIAHTHQSTCLWYSVQYQPFLRSGRFVYLGCVSPDFHLSSPFGSARTCAEHVVLHPLEPLYHTPIIRAPPRVII